MTHAETDLASDRLSPPQRLSGYLDGFCDREAVTVASALVGWELHVNGVGGRIVETEAYTAQDPASHSFSGRKSSNASMWLPPGYCYVYRIYGLHFCMNLVCADAGAVLIRALEPKEGLEAMISRRGPLPLKKLASGPGRLCQALAVDLEFDGMPMDRPPFALTPHTGGEPVVATSPRIGISKNADVPWRFCEAGSAFLSR